jgi:hypothetical protein
LGIGIYTTNWYLSDKPAGKIANNIQPSISAANQAIPQPGAGNANVRMPDVTGITQGTAVNNTRQLTGNTTTGTNRSNNQADNSTTVISYPDAGLVISNIPNANIAASEKLSDKNITEQDIAAKLNIAEAAIKEDIAEKTDKAASQKSITAFADAASESVLKENKSQSINWLQEYAVYQLTPAKPARVGLQMYFSPTVNYRKLSGSSYFTTSELKSIPLSPNIMGDVDQYVKHKPALGFELGTNLMYRYSKRITFKAGLQFNYSRYNIEAYSSLPEIATIALNNTSFIADTISTYSSIRNLSGYAQEDLSNQYFQLSMPVGLEFRVLGNDRMALNVAGTIQPTYLLNRNSYLITTDYKNYMREPSLVRRWNVNGGMEAYVSYNTGSVRWQVGPQFRYQLLSTYVRSYPIKEQLMEYGIKVGVSKTLR